MKMIGMTLVLLLAASAASAQTFDFTGVITSATYDPYYNPVTVGATITGSFTLDFANAQSITGQIGSANWSANEASVAPNPGLFPNSAPPTVFTLNAQSGKFNYSSVPADISAFNGSSIAGSHGVFSASEWANPAGAAEFHEMYDSSITLNGYGRTGLPTSNAMGSGQLAEGVMGSFSDAQTFTITSITRVVAPEIDPAVAASSGMLLLAAFAIYRGRRRGAKQPGRR